MLFLSLSPFILSSFLFICVGIIYGNQRALGFSQRHAFSYKGWLQPPRPVQADGLLIRYGVGPYTWSWQLHVVMPTTCTQACAIHIALQTMLHATAQVPLTLCLIKDPFNSLLPTPHESH